MVEQKDTGSEFNFLDSIVDTSGRLKMISSLLEVKVRNTIWIKPVLNLFFNKRSRKIALYEWMVELNLQLGNLST